MSNRRCPNCNEIVPSNSVTCPKCYSQVPRNDVSERKSSATTSSRSLQRNMTIATLLAAIPGIFGLQGLGLIYLDHKESKGWYFLIIGALIFMSMVLCVSWWDSVGSFTRVILIFALILLAIVYFSSYLAQLLETRFGSVLKFLRV
ncbi:MAG TPA: zinc ribbon domain-containing protein [Candidatus Methanomethylophilaceae archaeon]|nr:zinc ribbon domain-containing protein [Candidatus Methanomethylophilaceae archaeon]